MTELTQWVLTEPSTLENLAAALRAIADETRLRILDFLATGEQCVCDITQALGLSQPLASYHLAVLREAGLVHVRRDARWMYYSIHLEHLQDVIASCQQLFNPERVSSTLARKSREPCQ
ncbi:MAG: winged helix-turn-helix transcriptional regulator [Chloroflexi bacterium]|nr:winged helix-turn-helix transcriptional regulator [Chloroflexota bacterium]